VSGRETDGRKEKAKRGGVALKVGDQPDHRSKYITRGLLANIFWKLGGKVRGQGVNDLRGRTSSRAAYSSQGGHHGPGGKGPLKPILKKICNGSSEREK